MEELIRKYRLDSLSLDELQLLRNQLHDRHGLDAMIERDWNDFADDADTAPEGVRQRIYDQILNTLLWQQQRRKRRRAVLRWAAVIVMPLLIGVGAFWLTKLYNRTVLDTEVLTAQGEKASVLLPDSSRIMLNGASYLSYNAAGFADDNERVVEYAGEGYFEVAKQHDTRLTVHTRLMDVHITGTAFNLRAPKGTEQVELDLFSGSVTLQSTSSGRSVKLTAGQRAVYNGNSDSFAVAEIKENQNTTAWKTGRLEYKNARLDLVLQQLGRHYGCTFTAPAASAAARFTGQLPTDDAAMARAIIEKSFGIAVQSTK